MSCGYTETIATSKFKCVNGVLKEFPTLHHIFAKHGPPITGRTVGKCPVCGGGSQVKVGFWCLEVRASDYLGACNVNC